MDRSLHIPADLASRIQFRSLARDLDAEIAYATVFYLFRDLAYAAEAGSPLGQLSASRLQLLHDSITHDLDPAGQPPNPSPLIGPDSFLQPLPPPDTAYFCPMFAAENKHLARDFAPMAQIGGHARAAKAAAKQARIQGQQLSTLLPAGLFVIPRLPSPGGEGQGEGDPIPIPMTSDQVNQCMMVIKLFDNYLRKNRIGNDYSPGLIADAYRATLRWSEPDFHKLASWIHLHRDSLHPALPRTTEEILASPERFMLAAGVKP